MTDPIEKKYELKKVPGLVWLAEYELADLLAVFYEMPYAPFPEIWDFITDYEKSVLLCLVDMMQFDYEIHIRKSKKSGKKIAFFTVQLDQKKIRIRWDRLTSVQFNIIKAAIMRRKGAFLHADFKGSMGYDYLLMEQIARAIEDQARKQGITIK